MLHNNIIALWKYEWDLFYYTVNIKKNAYLTRNLIINSYAFKIKQLLMIQRFWLLRVCLITFSFHVLCFPFFVSCFLFIPFLEQKTWMWSITVYVSCFLKKKKTNCLLFFVSYFFVFLTMSYIKHITVNCAICYWYIFHNVHVLFTRSNSLQLSRTTWGSSKMMDPSSGCLKMGWVGDWRKWMKRWSPSRWMKKNTE